MATDYLPAGSLAGLLACLLACLQACLHACLFACFLVSVFLFLLPCILASFQSRTATRPREATVAPPKGRKVVSYYINHPSIQYHLMNFNVQSLHTSDGSIDPARSLCKDKPLGNLHKSHFAAGPSSSGCQDYKSKGSKLESKRKS